MVLILLLGTLEFGVGPYPGTSTVLFWPPQRGRAPSINGLAFSSGGAYMAEWDFRFLRG